MKKQFIGFLAGAITVTMIFGLGTTALAASGQITFNMSPIQFNGQQISAKGADYTLDNGCQAPSSITYTDEKGGGTTYLPVRRIAELMGVEIGYDAATGAVTVSGEQGVEQPETTTAPGSYSFDYTYEEFKELWNVELQESGGYLFFISNDKDKLKAWLDSVDSAIRDEYFIEITLEEFKNLGDSAPPKSMFRYGDRGPNIATVWPGNNNEVTVY